jgi:superfamily II DNA or RNA helicase
MTTNVCTVRILNEVHCVFVGLHPDHVGYFYEKYGVHATNYYFNPKFKLGSWDGKIRYFHKTGKTYVNLLEEILPQVIGLGYKINLDDLRKSTRVDPEPIDKDFFAHVIHPITDEPWEMRQYQVEMVNTLIANGGGVGIAGTGAGKDQPLYSSVLTTSGWKQMGDIFPGETVITPSGSTATVVDVFPQGEKDVYEITFHDGSKARCGIGHLWEVNFPSQLHKARTERRVVETSEIIEFLERKKSGVHTPGNISVPLTQPVEYQHKELPIDPYLLGALLGDGSLHGSIVLSSKDAELVDTVKAKISPLDLHVVYRGGVDYAIVKKQKQNSFPPSPNPLMEAVRSLGVYNKKSNEKFIPSEYKEGSVEQRFELLRGLMDTDGTADKRGNVSFTTVSKELAADVQSIVWSLGGTCTITTRTPTYTYNGRRKTGQLAYTCFIRHPNPKSLFTLERKKERCRECHGDGRIELMRRVVSVEKVDRCETQCIMLNDDDHLYITDDYIVTHNTSMTAAIAKIYEKAANYRSIIIVPDKNLTDQTFREYEFFGLDVGEFSGDRKDMKHQHIVSTWQSLQNNPNVIQDFQVIIVDEAHGLRGNVLTKLLTEYGQDIPYRFGVTGTLPKGESDALAVKIAVGVVHYTIPAHELQDQGYLAKLQIDVIQHIFDFKPKYTQYLEETDDPKPLTYRQFVDGYFPDYTTEKNYLQGHTSRIEWIADYITAKHELKRGNVLCLVNGVRFGKKLADLIPGAVFLSGKDKMKDRREVYQQFKDRNDVTVIATVQIASTGLDIPRIFNMIGIDMGKSFVRVIQSIGRGLRKAEDKDSVHFTDICSDLKYSRKHLTERKKYYKEAKYPFKIHKVDLS